MTEPRPGQRWISETEPELGPGGVRPSPPGRVRLRFPLTGETRVYAWPGAPIERLRLAPGDRFLTPAGERVVTAVADADGLLVYHTEAGTFREEEITATVTRRGPRDRLDAGSADSCDDFSLRLEALFRRAALRRSPVRGFTGGRVELIPWQLGIAAEVCARPRPRALLADEVGLGKTIEACLILHRLHVTGRADRALILVPEPLVHQWFVELLRRFHLLFSLYDGERCDALETGDPDANPFLDSQLVLAPREWLAENPGRAAQAVSAGWDLLAVDEAHHLAPDSAAYALVESLARDTPSVLLLTATPEQGGAAGHFARLRLLDPERYSDHAAHIRETAGYAALAEEAERRERAGADAGEMGAFLDRCGVGRVMFRHTRAGLAGFPGRVLRAWPLESPDAETRARWLARLLRSLGEDEKVLVIHAGRAAAEAMLELLLREISVKAGVFHEGLTLLQRDRQAAWFSEPDGARLLLCSEIGSEGRNFQFASHLALMDLPRDPDLLEQRIGRLDRIGQKNRVTAHVPYAAGGPEEVLLRWHAEGLGSFTAPVPDAAAVRAATSGRLHAALAGECGADELLLHTKAARRRAAEERERGFDRLLRLRPGAGEDIPRLIREADADTGFEGFCLRLLDHLGMEREELRARSWILQPGNARTASLPGMPPEGLSATFDRSTALQREDIAFFTQDHPLLRGALDLLLGGPAGSASVGVKTGAAANGLMLECCHVVECIAPPALHAERFLPPAPVRTVVDERAADRSDETEIVNWRVEDADALTARRAAAAAAAAGLWEKSAILALARRERVIRGALKRMRQTMEPEIARLRALREAAGTVTEAEISEMTGRQSALEAAIRAAGLRLDCARIVVCRKA